MQPWEELVIAQSNSRSLHGRVAAWDSGEQGKAFVECDGDVDRQWESSTRSNQCESVVQEVVGQVWFANTASRSISSGLEDTEPKRRASFGQPIQCVSARQHDDVAYTG